MYGTRRHLREALGDFFARRFPRAVRAHAWHLALAWGLTLLGALAGFALTRGDPERFYAFVDPAYAGGRGPTSSTASLKEVLYAEKKAADMLQAFAAFLFSHNARIGLTAFALGFAGGAPTALLLFSNGLLLGAFGALYASRGLSLDFWGWVLPHGVTELSAVALCGCGGLVLAQGLAFPGRSERLRNLAARGREAGQVALGAVALFFVAGLIEGIFRQRVHSVPVRYGVAGVTTVLLLLYFTLAGRRSPLGRR